MITRVCGSSGEWEGGSPLCHPITCGQPPLVENTLVDLLNSSTTWLSLALFSCKMGYSNSIPGSKEHTFCILQLVFEYLREKTNISRISSFL